MTVTYSLNVSEARLTGFPRLLLRWRGSIYKLLYREMTIFVCLYYSLLILYRLVLNENSRMLFEKLSLYCNAFSNRIPLSFVLAFYVGIVIARWWQQYLAIPWPDKCCMLISTYVSGDDERGRIYRRALARYLNLMAALTFQAISTAVKKRFPTIEHLIEAGLMTKDEKRVYDEVAMTHGKWWIPAQWFGSLAVRVRKEGRIKDDVLLKHLLDEMHVFRGNCGMLFSYDWISIPLVYTQVVTLAIYTYFFAALMGRQYLNPEKNYQGHGVNLFFPFFTILEFFFYMGWLKVAEQLINPFGEDDDDFELNWCMDRNLQLSYNVVDIIRNNPPHLEKDAHWEETSAMLPYTKSSFSLRSQPHLGSAINLDVNLEESEFMPMEPILEEDRENNCRSPPRSPSFDQGQYNFSMMETPTRRTSTCSTDIDNTSLSGFRLPNLGSRFFNMVLGSNKDLSHSLSSVKDGHSNSVSAPFTLRSPCNGRRHSSIEPSPLATVEGRATPDQQPLLPTFQEGNISENSTLLPSLGDHNLEAQIVFQDKPLEYCAIKVPDLSVVEEESVGSSIDMSPSIDSVNIELPLDCNSSSDESNTSCESISTSSDTQSTSSFSGLLKNQV